MRKQNNDRWKANGHAPVCPHCGTGWDGLTVGLYWDYDEHCWRCIICGYRGYEEIPRPKSNAEFGAEILWDKVLEVLDEVPTVKTGIPWAYL